MKHRRLERARTARALHDKARLIRDYEAIRWQRQQAPYRPVDLFTTRHLAQTAQNLLSHGHTLDDQQQQRLADALLDLTLQMEQIYAWRWLCLYKRKLVRALTFARWPSHEEA